MPPSFPGGGGWGPGPGPGPGGGLTLASALINIATRHIIRSKLLQRSSNKSLIPAALNRSSSLNYSGKVVPAAAVQRTSPATTTTKPTSTISYIFPSLHRTLHSQPNTPTSATILTSSALSHAAHQRIKPYHNPSRSPIQSSTRARLPINSTYQIHGPGLHLARNFSSAGAGGGGASTAVQESVPLFFRMLLDDEEKNRRFRKDGNRRNYGNGAASSTRRNTPRRPRRSSIRSSVIVPENKTHSAIHSHSIIQEEEINAAEYERYFGPSISEQAQRDAQDAERLTLIGEIRTRLLEEAGPHAPHISTVLYLLDESVDEDYVILLVPPQRPAPRPRSTTASTSTIQPTTTGGFLDDVHRAAAASEPRTESQGPPDYDRPARVFLQVLSALRSVLGETSSSSSQTATIRPGDSTFIPSTRIHLEGHAKADVIQLLHLMLDLQAQTRVSLHQQEGDRLTAEDIEGVLDVILHESAGLGLGLADEERIEEIREEDTTMENLTFRPTVLRSDDDDVGSPSIYFDFPLAPHSPRSEYTGLRDGGSSPRSSLSDGGSWVERLEVESSLTVRSPPRSALGVSLSSSSGSEQEEEEEEEEEGRWLYDSRDLVGDQLENS
ncbi:hypothetical protein A4X13_0g2399 [Tilletia indica]|uniref:Uncharacterized protein n=1 Tax=Tilletia indica TaxID=43049 RepID=A0A177TQM2_9BASI|nr:hypothetical protein A4X13_0g2399 [Tilletia indica]